MPGQQGQGQPGDVPADADWVCNLGCLIKAAAPGGVCSKHFNHATCGRTECLTVGKDSIHFTTGKCDNEHPKVTMDGMEDRLVNALSKITGGGDKGTWNLEPPAFPSKASEYKPWKEDLERWQRATSIPEDKRADVVLMKIPVTNEYRIRMGLLDKVNSFHGKGGMTKLLASMDELFQDEDLLLMFKANVEYKERYKLPSESYETYVNAMEVLRLRCKEQKIPVPDWMSCLNLLHQAKLPQLQRSLVWSAISQAKAEKSKVQGFNAMDQDNTPLLQVAYKTLKGLTSLNILDGGKVGVSYWGEETTDQQPLTDEEQRVALETALIAKNAGGGRGRGGGAKRGRGGRGGGQQSLTPAQQQLIAKHGGPGPGKFNQHGRLRKCFNCKGGVEGKQQPCPHDDTTYCTCPCTKHFAPNCPFPAKETKADRLKTKQAGGDTSTPAQAPAEMHGGAWFQNVMSQAGLQQPAQPQPQQAGLHGIAYTLQDEDEEMPEQIFIAGAGFEPDEKSARHPHSVRPAAGSSTSGTASNRAKSSDISSTAPSSAKTGNYVHVPDCNSVPALARTDLASQATEMIKDNADAINTRINQLEAAQAGPAGWFDMMQHIIRMEPDQKSSCAERPGEAGRRVPAARYPAQLPVLSGDYVQHIGTGHADEPEKLSRPSTFTAVAAKVGRGNEREEPDYEAVPQHFANLDDAVLEGEPPEQVAGPGMQQVESTISSLDSSAAPVEGDLLDRYPLPTPAQEAAALVGGTTALSTSFAMRHNLSGATTVMHETFTQLPDDTMVTDGGVACLNPDQVITRDGPTDPDCSCSWHVNQRSLDRYLDGTEPRNFESGEWVQNWFDNQPQQPEQQDEPGQGDPDTIEEVDFTLEELTYNAEEEGDYILVDSGAPTVLGGARFITEFILRYEPEVRKNLVLAKSSRTFAFGGGEKRRSMGRVNLPVCVMDKNGKLRAISIKCEVVACPFTMLLGLSFLIKAKGVIDVTGEELVCKAISGLGLNQEDKGIHMPRMLSGHLGVKIFHITTNDYNNKEKATEAVYWARQESMLGTVTAWDGDTIAAMVDLVLDQMDPSVRGEILDPSDYGAASFLVQKMVESETEQQAKEILTVYLAKYTKPSVREELSNTDVKRMHVLFGHCQPEKLAKLLSSAGRLSARVHQHVLDLANCEVCAVYKRRVPNPKIALPKLQGFNTSICIDLKENKKWSNGRPFILYVSCAFSKLTKGKFIKEKTGAAVVRAFHKIWTAPYRAPAHVHADCGGEFSNKDFEEYCRYFNIRFTTTSARSPHSNGISERLHSLCDLRMEKIMSTKGVDCKPSYALDLALASHNSMTKLDGFSPDQLAFMPKVEWLPQVDTASPGQLEAPSRSEVVARMVEEFNATREAFVFSQADQVVREALKQRVYTRVGAEVQSGDWIYWKDPGVRGWQGPVRVNYVFGKTAYCARAGRQIAVNCDYIILAKSTEAMNGQYPDFTSIPPPTGEFLNESYHPSHVSQQDVCPRPADIAPAAAPGPGVPGMSPDSSEGQMRVPPGGGETEPGDEQGQVVGEGAGNDALTAPPAQTAEPDLTKALPSTDPGPDRLADTITDGAGRGAALPGPESGGEEVDSSGRGSQPPAHIRTELELQQLSNKLGQCKRCSAVLYKSQIKPHCIRVHSGSKRAISKNLYWPCGLAQAEHFLEVQAGEEGQQQADTEEVPTPGVGAPPAAQSQQPQHTQFRPADIYSLNGRTKGYEIISKYSSEPSDTRYNVLSLTDGSGRLTIDLAGARLEGRIESRSSDTIKLNHETQGTKEILAGEFYQNVPTELWGGSGRPVERQAGPPAAPDAPAPRLNRTQSAPLPHTKPQHTKALSDSLLDSSLANRSSACLGSERSESQVSEVIQVENDALADLTLAASDVPYNQYGTVDSLKAKKKEIQDLFDFQAIGIVNRKDLPDTAVILDFVWLLQDKVRPDGSIKRKARLCVNGKHEPNKDQLETRSPTARKGNVRLAYAMAATYPQYTVACSDITRSFLQGRKLERKVYVKPVPEFGLEPGQLIECLKPLYGLADGSYQFFVEHHLSLTQLGMEVLVGDPATTVHHTDNSEPGDEEREWSGMNCQHVDDNVQVMSDKMYNEVYAPMKQKFAYGTQEELQQGGELEFLGMRLRRTKRGLVVDQDKYVANLQPVEIPQGLLLMEALPDKGQTEYRSLVAKLQQLAVSCKPAIMVQTKELATRNGEATKKDTRALNKLLAKVKSGSTKMMFPHLGDREQWMIVAYSDASFRQTEDALECKGGRVVMICNRITHAAAVLGWRSGGMTRVVRSPKAAETLSLGELLDDVDRLKQTLSQMFGTKMYSIPTLVCIDCADLAQSINSLKEIRDQCMILEATIIKQKVDTLGLADEIRLVKSEDMVADGLTKKSAPAQSLEQVLETGWHIPPGGYKITERKDIPKKLWASIAALPKGKTLRNSRWASATKPEPEDF